MPRIIAFVLMAACALAQMAPPPPKNTIAVGNRDPVAGPQLPPPKKARPKQAPRAPLPPDPDEGSVSDDTYTNPFFGLEYTFPENLDVQDQTHFMQGELDQTNRAFVLLAAYGDAPSGGGEGVVLMADSARQYAPLTDPADYIARALQPILQKQGFEPLPPPRPLEIAGQKFVRADFRKQTVQQAAVFTLRHGYVLGFTFIAPGAEELERLLESLKSLRFAAQPAPATPRKAPGKQK